MAVIDNETQKRFEYGENVIEWRQGENIVILTLHQKRLISRIKKLQEQKPEDVVIFEENPDGSILAQMPLSYLRFRAPMDLTEEQRAKLSEIGKRNIHNVRK